MKVKDLTQSLAGKLGCILERLDNLPNGFPQEVVECIPHPSADHTEIAKEVPNELVQQFEQNIANKSIKKEYLVSAVVSFHIDEAMEQEEKTCALWETQVEQAIKSSSSAALGDPDLAMAGAAGKIHENDKVFAPFPPSVSSNHWLAHQAASLLSLAILSAYYKTPVSDKVKMTCEDSVTFNDSGFLVFGLWLWCCGCLYGAGVRCV